MKHIRRKASGRQGGELKFWKWLAILCAIAAAPQLCWAPARFGGIFFGALAIGSGGEYFCLRQRGTHKLFGALAVLGRVLFGIFLASIVIVQGMIIVGMRADEDAAQADAILVLGARVYENGEPSATLAARLDAAQAFLDEHPDAVAVLCGGQGANEPCPEAEAMRAYLLARGVPENRLLLEDQSNNTIQNIANAKVLLDARFGQAYRTAVLSSDFHLARARRLMLHAGLDPYAVPAETPYFMQRLALHLREYGSIMGLVLTGRW